MKHTETVSSNSFNQCVMNLSETIWRVSFSSLPFLLLFCHVTKVANWCYIVLINNQRWHGKVTHSSKDFTEYFYGEIIPSRHLLVQSQQWKPQNNMGNLFKVNNKDTRTTSIRILLTCNRFHSFFCYFLNWLWTNKYRLGWVFSPLCSYRDISRRSS